MGQFGVQLVGDTINIEPVFDETQDAVTGWVMDVTLRLIHSNCVTPMGDITFTVPGTSNISLRYLTCETLNNCDTFNQAIQNLQDQIDNIIVGEICDVLEDCEVIQEIQSDILSLSGDTINNTNLINSLQLSTTTFNNQIQTLQLSATTQQIQINNILTGQTSFYIAVNFEDVDTFTYIAPETFRIDSIDNPGGLTLTTNVNASPYTLGNTITLYDTLTILPSGTGFIKLNCTLL
jgi:hypothetical protein